MDTAPQLPQNLQPAWAAEYSRRYRRAGAVWFVGLVALVGGILCYQSAAKGRFETRYALYGTLGFAAVTLMLSASMFRGFNRCWRGRVEGKDTQEIYAWRDDDGQRRRTRVRTAYRLRLRTDRGRTLVAEVSPAAFEYVRPGDWLVKYKGVPSPVKVLGPEDTQRLCPSCGGVFARELERCPACRMAVYD